MNLFEKYKKAFNEYSIYRDQINALVIKYIEKHVGFAGEAGDYNNIGKTNRGEISWNVSINKIIIHCSVYADRWLDYWKDEDLSFEIDFNIFLNETKE